MAQVPWIVYVGVGALVTVGSLMVGKEFKLFFYAGLAFLVFGLGVSFIGALEYHGAKKTEQKYKKAATQEISTKYPQYAQQYGGASQGGQAPASQQRNYKVCARCNTPARLSDNFCGRCGNRV